MVIVRFLRNLLITIAVLVGLVAVGVVATDGMLRGELEKQAATQVEDAAGFDQPRGSAYRRFGVGDPVL